MSRLDALHARGARVSVSVQAATQQYAQDDVQIVARLEAMIGDQEVPIAVEAKAATVEEAAALVENRLERTMTALEGQRVAGTPARAW
jgi:VIT1/CCC1 family predicted Fe2+/Mn2+ transporter